MMDLESLLGRLPGWVRRTGVDTVNAIDPLRLWVSRRVINGYARRTPPRPRPLSMAADYTTWPGLMDRRFSGRHLAVEGEVAPPPPNIDDVVALFERKEFRPANDTSLLFAFFAQWFTDGFLRTKWEEGSPRHFRENESNHEIDLCQIYGVGEVQTSMLRDPDGGGRLRSRRINEEEWPAPLFEERDGRPTLAKSYERTPEKDEFTPALPGLYSPVNYRRVFGNSSDDEKRYAFAVGLEHGNSTLGQVMMNTLFLREHNRTADILRRAHSDWCDERLFQTARNTTIAVLLKIVVGDYIVHIAPVDVRLEAPPGMAEGERWYRNNWMAVEFALLYRWHDLIPDAFEAAGERRPASALRGANKWLLGTGLDEMLLASSSQRAGRIGLGNTAGFLLDVKRLSLQMARDCRLPSFNAYRRHYGLKPVASFEELTGDREAAGRLRDLYRDVDRLEWFVGLFAENYGERHMMGELLTTMVANDAFTQALTNPLLAEAVHNEATFGEEGLALVRETRTLAQVIARNTRVVDPARVGFKVRERGVAAAVFKAVEGTRPIQPA